MDGNFALTTAFQLKVAADALSASVLQIGATTSSSTSASRRDLLQEPDVFLDITYVLSYDSGIVTQAQRDNFRSFVTVELEKGIEIDTVFAPGVCVRVCACTRTYSVRVLGSHSSSFRSTVQKPLASSSFTLLAAFMQGYLVEQARLTTNAPPPPIIEGVPLVSLTKAMEENIEHSCIEHSCRV